MGFMTVGLAVLAAVALLAWTQHRALRWPSDAECAEILRQEGVDPSKPRMIDFHVHFPSREMALRAERAIQDLGFEVHVGGGPGSPRAILCARKMLLPTKAALRAVRRELGPLSRTFGGSYQGCLPRGSD
jgi:hypothetical protein